MVALTVPLRPCGDVARSPAKTGKGRVHHFSSFRVNSAQGPVPGPIFKEQHRVVVDEKGS